MTNLQFRYKEGTEEASECGAASNNIGDMSANVGLNVRRGKGDQESRSNIDRKSKADSLLPQSDSADLSSQRVYNASVDWSSPVPKRQDSQDIVEIEALTTKLTKINPATIMLRSGIVG